MKSKKKANNKKSIFFCSLKNYGWMLKFYGLLEMCKKFQRYSIMSWILNDFKNLSNGTILLKLMSCECGSFDFFEK